MVRLKFQGKSIDFLLLGMANITFQLRFMKSNKFYNIQTAEVVNSKDVKGSNFVCAHGDKFSPIFQILIF